jgi:nicotinamidase/pyrazinamidase
MNSDNLVKIDEIVVTLDSHLPNHIAHARGWKDSSGQPPAVFSQITAQQIKDDIWIPVNLDPEYCLRYTESLEKKGKFLLTIWPEHCIIGTNGHNVFPPLQEALEEWTLNSTRAWTSVMKV